MSREGLLRVVYKGIYANHRYEGGTRLQRTVLRPESDVASEHMAASIAQLRASALHHRRDSSTADGPIEPDFRVRGWRAQRHRQTNILWPSVIGTPLRTILRSRSRRDALAPRANASIAAQRMVPSSPISEFGRGAHSAIVLSRSARIVTCTVTNATLRRPSGCQRAHRRWLCAHRASVRILCAAAPRGPLDHRATTRELRPSAEHTKLNTKKERRSTEASTAFRSSSTSGVSVACARSDGDGIHDRPVTGAQAASKN